VSGGGRQERGGRVVRNGGRLPAGRRPLRAPFLSRHQVFVVLEGGLRYRGGGKGPHVIGLGREQEEDQEVGAWLHPHGDSSTRTHLPEVMEYYASRRALSTREKGPDRVVPGPQAAAHFPGFIKVRSGS